MRFRIEAGGEVETVTPKELGQALADERYFWKERATGVKWTEQGFNLPVPPAAAGPSYQIPGPNQGFAWKLRLVSVQLASAGTLLLYKGETNNLNYRLIGQGLTSLTSQVIFFPDDIIIQAGQQVFAFASQNLTSIYWGAVQVPAERLGEILS